MEVTPPPLKLELADHNIIQFEAPLLKYIAYFKSLYEEGFRQIKEDAAFQLPWIFWDWIHAVLAEHEDVYLSDDALKVPLHLAKTKEIEYVTLDDIYRILRVTNFYDIPLVTDFLIKEVIKCTLPLQQRALMLANPSIKPPKITELMLAEPIEILNEQYTLHRAFLMKIYRNHLNMYDLYNLIDRQYLPRITNIMTFNANSVMMISKTDLFRKLQNKTDDAAWEKMDINDAISIWATRHTMMILTTRGLYANGNNEFGQLGLGHEETISIAESKEIKLPQVLTVACSPIHSLFITVDGVYATGYGKEGQLGNGTTIRRNVPTPVTIEENVKIIAIGASSEYSLFLSDKGVVYFSGETPNDNIIAETKAKTVISLPTALTLPEDAGKIIDISTTNTLYGTNHSILIDDSQNVYIFGNNNSGELGLGHKLAIKGIQKIPTLKRIVKARAIGSWSFFIDAKRNLYGCGFNGANEIDVTSAVYITTPVPIFKTKDVIDVTIFNREIYALRCDGLYLSSLKRLVVVKQKLDVEDLDLCPSTLAIEEEEEEEPEQKRKRFQSLHCYQCGTRQNLSIHQASKHLFCSFDCLAKLRALNK